ncbi:MAG TPA: serine/threonine-protein kinase PknK, partial [Stellaceae bacterium]|nr:serine/threonine-protein kinase PknK [Stellaceae bacterium]
MEPLFRSGAQAEGDLLLLEDNERVFCRRWRVSRDGSHSSVLVILPAAQHPTSSCLERLDHEFGLKDELDGAWALRPLELTREGSRTTLVLEDPGGEPLERLLGEPLEIERFLRVAIEIVAALGKAHQCGLVHKDIRPTNIVINQASGEVRLTGFGIASRLPRERQAPEPPETIAGTLAYMAPEQTGRMNRSIDSRSDLYALGCTFYQMLTGSLPFSASDPMEWVHCHVARRPVPPAEQLKNVPGAVSSIIMKLLAKTAEERYQTAGGVERDLRRCLAEWEAGRNIDDFAVGQHDMSDRLLIPEKLYGRSRECEVLLASFERAVTSGSPELVLVTGYSGIGKSSVINELHKALVPLRGQFAAGKFDQYKRDIPYSTLAQSLKSLVRPLLGKSDVELRGWAEAVLAALGPNARLMVDLIPELTLIIGEQPPVPELPPQDAQRRFQLVLRRFIGVFARPEHPLALFLDDLQWLDAATLDLLEDILTRSDLQNLMLIGAYRDNEVTADHPLRRKLDAIRSAGGRIAEITLAPLACEHLGQLIVDTLRCDPIRGAQLAQLVHAKTGGNPFFAIQFLSSLAEQKLLSFDHAAARWSWDPKRIHGKGYTDNVVDLMVAKLIRLPTETQKALRQLACLGSIASIKTLSLVLGISEEQIHLALWPAVRQELVEGSAGSFRFAHDRIQEAAYSLVPESERAAEHLRIGRLFTSRTASLKIEENIFEVVSHFNRGAELITLPDERERLAELNLIAGRQAKQSSAYAAALKFFALGRALLAQECWDRNYKLTFALELQRAECEFLTGDHVNAEQHLALLSSRAVGLADQASVACLRIDLLMTLGHSNQSVEVGLDYLRSVGVAWPPHPAQDEVRHEFKRIWQQIGSRPIQALIDLPLMEDPRWQAQLNVLTALLPPTLFTDENLFSLVVARMANISVEHGNTHGSCLAYVWLGLLLGPHFGNYPAAFEFGQLGLDLVEKRGLTRFRARVYLDFSHVVNPWRQHARSGPELVQRALDVANEIGDLTFAAYSSCNLVSVLLAAGVPLAEVHREAERRLEFARQLQFGLIVDIITGQLRLIMALRGLTPSLSSFDGPEFAELPFEHRLERDPGLTVAIGWYWPRKLQGRVFACDAAGAMEAVLKVEPFLWTITSHLEIADYHFYAALARSMSYES